jgi:hypothetical protein
MSTPSTSAPRRAAGSAVVPSPQPRSSTFAPFPTPRPRANASPLSRIVAAMRVKSPFSHSAWFGFGVGFGVEVIRGWYRPRLKRRLREPRARGSPRHAA